MRPTILFVVGIPLFGFLARALWPAHPLWVIGLVDFGLVFFFVALWAIYLGRVRLLNRGDWLTSDYLTFAGLALAILGIGLAAVFFYNEQPKFRILKAQRIQPPIPQLSTYREIKDPKLGKYDPSHYFRFSVVNMRGGDPDMRLGLTIVPPANLSDTDLDIYRLWVRRNDFPTSPDGWEIPPAVHNQRIILRFSFFGKGEKVDIVLGYALGRGGRLRVQVSPEPMTQSFDLP